MGDRSANAERVFLARDASDRAIGSPTDSHNHEAGWDLHLCYCACPVKRSLALRSGGTEGLRGHSCRKCLSLLLNTTVRYQYYFSWNHWSLIQALLARRASGQSFSKTT